MADPTVAPLGPLFGPDFVIVHCGDGKTVPAMDLEVFPDANNAQLRANGLPIQYYYMPQEIHLATKPNSTDFDFSVTLFKGLMTTEDTTGIANVPSTGGEVDAGGAFVTFSTTMAVPDAVLADALTKLKAGQTDPPPPRIAALCQRGQTDPAPLLGIVPIVDNQVTIEVPNLPLSTGSGSTPPATTASGGGATGGTATTGAATGGAAAGGTAAGGTAAGGTAAGSTAAGSTPPAQLPNNGNPWFISAQGTGHGSIEASGISSFLVTCNQFAAGAIVGSLQQGQSPFTVHYNMTMMFYMNACQIHMDVDVDKVFTQLSGAAEAKFGFAQVDLQANYQTTITNGGITTIINENGVAVDADLKAMIDKQVGEMQDNAWNLVKAEIFNWQPTPDAPATASAGPCGGVAVTLKLNYQMHAVHFNQSFTLNDSVTKLDTKSGTLTELQPAITANLNKYLAIVDIGEYFQKIQVAATANIDFSNVVPTDPITAAYISVAYPKADASGNYPLDSNGVPVLQTLGSGYHYTPGNPNAPSVDTLGSWTKTNPVDIINFSFMRMLKPLPNWDPDQVVITKKLEYDPDDPRVDLSTKTTEIIITSPPGKDHTPVVSPADVGYIYVKFVLDRAIASNVMVTLTITLTGSQGTRTDTLTLTSTDPRQKPTALWQVFSDKYFDATIAQVNIAVEVAPPPNNFMGAPVTWSGVEAVPVGLGRIKEIVPYTLTLPVLTDPTQAALAGQYILQTQQQALAAPAS